jgi:hypothetical protein
MWKEQHEKYALRHTMVVYGVVLTYYRVVFCGSKIKFSLIRIVDPMSMWDSKRVRKIGDLICRNLELKV